jgi:hypothetical protein
VILRRHLLNQVSLKAFVPLIGMRHVRTSPYYPQSNDKPAGYGETNQGRNT